MKRVLLILLSGLVVATACAQPLSPDSAFKPRPIYPDAAPVCAPEDLRKVSIPNTTIESVRIDPTDGSCRVTAIVSHPPANDRVTVYVGLPMKGWNGRFRGNGGGGFVGGRETSLRAPLAQGFATAATDTGHEGGSARFAMGPNGRLNWQEIRDNAYLGIHAMTVVGKALTEAFYGKPPRYSYFVGNSTGGRQGLMEAQRYPEDYDGILSGCPAINWPRFLTADLWPQAVMIEAANFVSKAKLDAVTAAVVAACDERDGVKDGIIDDPLTCAWDPGVLVGTVIGESTFTEADAQVIRRIWEGPRRQDGRFIYYGLTRGTNLFELAGTTGSPLRGRPFGIALEWCRYFLVQDPQWDASDLTAARFELLWNQAVEQYGEVFGSDNPDLTRFRDRGGRLIIAHGLADQQIPVQGSIEYYERVMARMGGLEPTREFARLFLMPGLNHGFRGAAPAPVGMFEVLMRWVEEGGAPERIEGEQREGGKLIRTRPFFPYPQRAKYSGRGNPDDAASYLSVMPGQVGP